MKQGYVIFKIMSSPKGTTTLASEYAYAAPYSQYSYGPYGHSATGLLSKW